MFQIIVHTELFKKIQIMSLTLMDKILKVGHSSNFLYQRVAEKYFKVSTYIAKLKTKKKIGGQCASY